MRIKTYKIIIIAFFVGWGQSANSTNVIPDSSGVAVLQDSNISELSPQTGEGNWYISAYQQKFTFVSVGEILVPIVFEKSKLIATNEIGTILYEDKELITATLSRIDQIKLPSDFEFKQRPTLYISIAGFQPKPTEFELNISDDPRFSINGETWSTWQDYLNSKLEARFSENEFGDGDYSYQYHHLMVHWDTIKSTKKQAEALSRQVKKFLNDRQHKWDVVLIGHSRGALMAYRLNKYLVGHGKIENLHSYLLDPTAAAELGDQYPTSLPVLSPTKSWGSVIYDQQNLIGINGIGFDVGTIWSDMDILGYETNIIGAQHHTIHKEWIDDENNGFTAAIDRMEATKDTGSYAPDGTLGLTKITVSTNKDFDLWAEAYCNSSNCAAGAELLYDGFSVAYIEGEVSTNGIAGSYGLTAIAAGQLAIKRDQIFVAQTVGIPGVPVLQAAVSGGIDSRGISGNARFIGIRGGVSLNTSTIIAVDFDAFGLVGVEWDPTIYIMPEEYYKSLIPDNAGGTGGGGISWCLLC